MPVRVADGGGPGTGTITYRSETALRLADEALQYAEGHWPDETDEYEHVVAIQDDVRKALEAGGEVEIPVEHSSERRGLFLFALSLYGQWLRDAADQGWDIPYDTPVERAGTVDQLAGPFKAHEARERQRREKAMREKIADVFSHDG